MNRIDSRFESLAAANRCALIPFVTVGDPHPDWTVSTSDCMMFWMHQLTNT